MATTETMIELTMRHFPQWPRRVITFPCGGALVHVSGKIGSGKTTFFDAVAFALTGVVRASISVMGGVAANGGKVPEVTLRNTNDEWRITRTKKRNGLSVQLKTAILQDDVAQTWINDTFGVTDQMLYVATYMPHRRPRSGLLCMAPGTRRELLQNHFAEGLHLSKKQDLQARFLTTLSQVTIELTASIKSLKLVSPVQQRGAAWINDRVMPRLVSLSEDAMRVVRTHGIIPRIQSRNDDAMMMDVKMMLQASSQTLIELLKQDTPAWHAGIDDDWHRFLWDAVPDNVAKILRDEQEVVLCSSSADAQRVRKLLLCSRRTFEGAASVVGVDVIQSRLAIAIELDAIVHMLPSPHTATPYVDRTAEKNALSRRLVALDHLLGLMKDAAYAVAHAKHDATMRAEQHKILQNRQLQVQTNTRALCDRLQLGIITDKQVGADVVTAEALMMALDTLQRRIHGIGLLEAWIQDVASEAMAFVAAATVAGEMLRSCCQENTDLCEAFEADDDAPIVDVIAWLLDGAGQSVVCPCCGTPLLVQDESWHTCTPPSKRTRKTKIVRDNRGSDHALTDARLFDSLCDIRGAFLKLESVVTRQPGHVLDGQQADVPDIDELTATWKFLRAIQCHTLTMRGLKLVIEETRTREETLRGCQQRCVARQMQLESARKELHLYRTELSRGEGQAADLIAIADGGGVHATMGGRWTLPRSLNGDMHAWEAHRQQLLETRSMVGSELQDLTLHPDWLATPIDIYSIAEDALNVVDVQRVRNATHDRICVLQQTEDAHNVQHNLNHQHKQQIRRANESSVDLFAAMGMTGEWDQMWIRDRRIVERLQAELSDAANNEQRRQQHHNTLATFEQWVTSNESYCDQVNNWLQQVWVHVCALSRAIHLERIVQIMHEASLVANGAFVELAVQRLSVTINHFLSVIIPEVELSVDLCLSGAAKTTVVAQDRKPAAHGVLTLTQALADKPRPQTGMISTKPQILVCTKLRGVELDMDALSGGQYFALQLASLAACATVTNSRLLLLDEALGLMDEVTLARVLVPLTQLAHSHGILILSIAHNLHTAYFDGTLVFDEFAERVSFTRHQNKLCLSQELD